MNVQEAFERLKAAGITDSIQTVRRWCREGKIQAKCTKNRKAGYEIKEDALQAFINQWEPAPTKARIRALELENEQLRKEVAELKALLQEKNQSQPVVETKFSAPEQKETVHSIIDKYKEIFSLPEDKQTPEYKQRAERFIIEQIIKQLGMSEEEAKTAYKKAKRG